MLVNGLFASCADRGPRRLQVSSSTPAPMRGTPGHGRTETTRCQSALSAATHNLEGCLMKCGSAFVRGIVGVKFSAVLLLVVSVCGCGCSDAPSGMVLVPAGTFTMGSDHSRQVTLTRDFYMGRHEVTNRDYVDALQWAYEQGHVTVAKLYETTERRGVFDALDNRLVLLLQLDHPDSEVTFSGGRFTLREAEQGAGTWTHPVNLVTWQGAARYCDWLSVQEGLPRAYQHEGDWSCNGGDPYGAEGYRLPTEAEWEYAAQYNDDRVYPWGNEEPDPDALTYRWGKDESAGGTLPVASNAAENSALGLADMAGNVHEWCNDWFQDDLGYDPVTDPAGPRSGRNRIRRGGSWDYGWEFIRCDRRNMCDPEHSDDANGFRIARTRGF